jgi:hypothetical protein
MNDFMSDTGELVGELVAQGVAARPHGGGHRLLGRDRVDQPPLSVAADPGGVGQLAQPRHGLGGPRAERRHVAAEQPGLDVVSARVVEYGLERR